MLHRVQHHSASVRLVSLQFVSLAAVGMVSPYINLYLVDANFSATMIGTLSSLGAILALTLTPMLNQVADRRMLHRRLFMTYMLGFAIANSIFAITQVHLLLIIAVLLTRITVGPSLTLGMQLTMTEASRHSKAVLGQIRSFAAMGFSAASLLAGQLFTIGGYSLLFWIGAAFAAITVQVSTIFPAKSEVKDKPADTKSAPRHRGLYVLIVSQFFIMMGTQNTFAFLFIHLTENLGIPTGNIGIWAAFLAGIEIPFFILTDRILPIVPTKYVYIGASLGMAVFVFLLGIVPASILLILLISFRGVMWPMLYLSSFTIVSEISKKTNVATNQAIMQVTMPNIAVLLTGSAFGWIFDHLGAYTFFALSALSIATGAAIVLVFYRLFDVPNSGTSP